MMLYVNGDSHTAAAEAVNSYAFAEDDSRLGHLQRMPHPDNLAVSWGKQLAELIKTGFKCDAESAASNTRIIRTTKEWVDNNKHNYPELIVIIGWSTWEREEWLIDDTYYQIGASGIDDVPSSHKEQYKKFVANVNWTEKTSQAHEDAWELHKWLENKDITHVFFNCNNDFSEILVKERHNWGTSYIQPYSNHGTYDTYLKSKCYYTVSVDSYHYSVDGHTEWSRFLLKYIVNNNLI